MTVTGHRVPRRPTDHIPNDQMTRRLLGAAVLTGVLLVIVVVAGVRGRTVAGEPTAQPIKAAPQAGDCVTENPHDLGANLFDLPAIPTGSCSGPRFGEVVFIVPEFTVPTADAPLSDPCREPVDEYLGTPAPPLSDGSFVQVAGVEVSLLGPDSRQRAAGQNWAACTVFLPISIDASAPITVDHSLQGAWQRRDDSQLFAICGDDATSLLPVGCRSPHDFEVLGLALGTAGASQDAVTAACRQVVIDALGSSTALDRGDLSTSVVPARPRPNGELITGPDAITADSEYFNNCLATPTDGTKRLTAPLRGLGDAAVPMN